MEDADVAGARWRLMMLRAWGSDDVETDDVEEEEDEDVEEEGRSQDRDPHCVRGSLDMSQLRAALRENFQIKFRRHPQTKAEKTVLHEPAQSKDTWTFHKNHFVWKFKGTAPEPRT